MNKAKPNRVTGTNAMAWLTKAAALARDSSTPNNNVKANAHMT
jgi:hypothetical protein